MTSSPEEDIITGSCLCGQVKYTLSRPPWLVAICHCHDCRKASSSAFMTNAFFDEEAFTIVSGEDQVKTYTGDTFGGKPPIHRSFCGNCGCRLWGVSPTNPMFIGKRSITIGSIDEGKGGNWKPQVELFSIRCWDWIKIDEGITKFETTPDKTG